MSTDRVRKQQPRRAGKIAKYGKERPGQWDPKGGTSTSVSCSYCFLRFTTTRSDAAATTVPTCKSEGTHNGTYGCTWNIKSQSLGACATHFRILYKTSTFTENVKKKEKLLPLKQLRFTDSNLMSCESSLELFYFSSFTFHSMWTFCCSVLKFDDHKWKVQHLIDLKCNRVTNFAAFDWFLSSKCNLPTRSFFFLLKSKWQTFLEYLFVIETATTVNSVFLYMRLVRLGGIERILQHKSIKCRHARAWNSLINNQAAIANL